MGLSKCVVGQGYIQTFDKKTYSYQIEQYSISVNGVQQELSKNKKISLTSDKKISAILTEDNTVVIFTPSSRITHSGKTVEIEETGPADGSHCGLCGDYNKDKRADLKSPKKCIFKSNSLFGKSYRSKSSQCTPLPQHTQQKIMEEEQRCAKYETKKTHVSSIYSSGQKDSYSIKKHSYI